MAKMDPDQSGQSGQPDAPNLLTIDDVSYPIEVIPDEIKVLVNDLIRVNQELLDLQYRVRLAQAAQQTYINTIRSELKRREVKPYDADQAAD